MRSYIIVYYVSNIINATYVPIWLPWYLTLFVYFLPIISLGHFTATGFVKVAVLAFEPGPYFFEFYIIILGELMVIALAPMFIYMAYSLFICCPWVLFRMSNLTSSQTKHFQRKLVTFYCKIFLYGSSLQ